MTTKPPWYNTAVVEWMAEVRWRILDNRCDREKEHTPCLKRQTSMPGVPSRMPDEGVLVSPSLFHPGFLVHSDLFLYAGSHHFRLC